MRNLLTVEKNPADDEAGRRKNAVPDYHRQLRNEIIGQIVTGRLRSGERLPPIEEMAREVEVSVHTVARVYRELAQEGVLDTDTAQHGTFVATPSDETLVEYGYQVISPAIRELRRLGYSERLVRRLVEQACEAWLGPSSGSADADRRSSDTMHT